MYVISIHAVSDPEAFWSGKLELPDGTELPIVVPSADGKRGVCVFKSDSVNTVRNVVDGATGKDQQERVLRDQRRQRTRAACLGPTPRRVASRVDEEART